MPINSRLNIFPYLAASMMLLPGILLFSPGLALAEPEPSRKDTSSTKNADKPKSRTSFSGYMMFDADYYSAYYSQQEDAAMDLSLRRAKISIKHRSKDKLKLKLQLAYDDKEQQLDIDDAWLRYSELQWADITVGKMKEPFGYERLQNSPDNLNIERSMISSAFTPGRSYGLMLDQQKKKYTWAVGIFQEDDEDDEFDNRTPTAVTARGSLRAYKAKRQTLHLGAAASYRDWEDNEFRIRDSAEVYSADNIVRSAEFNADKLLLTGLEAGWQYDSLLFQGEFMRADVEQTDGEDWAYDGFYLQASYIPGGSRRYKNGFFEPPKIRKNAQLWEFSLRYSELNLRDNGLGANASASTLGATYYLSRQTRMMLNLQYADIEGNTLNDEGDGQAVALRIQHQFDD